MHYMTAFDISDSGYRGAAYPAFGAIFLMLGALLLIHRWQPAVRWNQHPLRNIILALSFLAFSLGWVMVAFGAEYQDYLWQMAERLPGGYGVVEGPLSGAAPRLCVQERCFDYSGAAVLNGARARLTYIGHVVIKLDVADQPVSSVP